MMQLINKVKGYFMRDEYSLLTVCATLVLLSAIGAGAYYKTQESAMMSRNIENGIVKGVDPVAVRCAYADKNDNVCVAYAAAKDHSTGLSVKK